MADKGYALRRWDGSTWNAHPVKRWNGSAWQWFALRRVGMPTGGGGTYPAHPGIVVNNQTIEAVKFKLATGDTWTTEMFNDLGGLANSVSGVRTTSATRSFLSSTFTPAPLATINDGVAIGGTGSSGSINTFQNRAYQCSTDSQAAYCNALAYALTGTTRYATKAIEIFDAWRTTMTTSTGWTLTDPTRSGVVKTSDGSSGIANGKFISAWCCANFARAAEIIRYLYPPWGETAATAFGDWLQLVFYTQTGALTHGGFSNNWFCSFADARMSLAVYRKDDVAFQSAVSYARNVIKAAFTVSSDRGDASLPTTHIPIMSAYSTFYNTKARVDAEYFGWGQSNTVGYLHGQNEETTRDIGHTIMGFVGAGHVCETAWHQGTDLYADVSDRLIASCELHADYMIQYIQQYPSTWQTNVEPAGAWKPTNYPWTTAPFEVGGDAWKVGWEIIYNHYVNRRGLSMPKTGQLINLLYNNGFYIANNGAWDSLTHHNTGSFVPTNALPTASFSHTITGSVVDVNAAASTDPDGTITSYTWDWGDGTTSSGVTDSHDYASDGDYTITLTVVDDDGGIASTTKNITIDTSVVFASDDFSDNQTNTWSNADVGGPWTTSGVVGSSIANDFDKAGGKGTIYHQAANTRRWAILQQSTVLDSDSRVTFSWDTLPNANSARGHLVARWVDSSNKYYARIRIETGTVYLQMYRWVAGVEAQVGSTNVQLGSGAYTPGDGIKVRFRCTGSNPTRLQAKVWAATDSEPTAWQIDTTDSSSALQVAAYVGIESYVTGSVTNTPTLSVDDYSVRTSGGGAPVLPTAAFTTSQSGMTVDVNGSTSTAPGSSITSYTWDWGDSSTDTTGVTSSHLYAAAGTYTITLTVVDANGNTASATADVTIGAVAADDFSDTSASTWASADIGGSWTINTYSAAAFSKSGGKGLMTLTQPDPAVTVTGQAYLGSVSAIDVDLRADVSLDITPTGGGCWPILIARRVDASNYYMLRLRINPTDVYLQTLRVVAGAQTTIASYQVTGTNGTYAANRIAHLRFRVAGSGTTTLQGKVWFGSDPEPTAWQLSNTDTSAALQAAGGVGCWTQLAASNAEGAVVASWDNFQA